MARRALFLCALIGALVASALPSLAQEAPPPPVQPVGVGGMGVFSAATMRVGTEAVGVCAEPDPLAPYTPYGNGLGLLEPGKQLHWRLSAEFGLFFFERGRVDLCGNAEVPVAQVPEIGTAGACDSPAVTGARGRFELVWRLVSTGSVTHEVDDVSSTPTGGVVVVTGRVLGAEGEEPGSLLMLLQRRTHGMCTHKNHEATRIGTTYPQGGKAAELIGVIAYQLPRARVANTACEDEWGQARRHLRGAGAGMECPVPPEI